MPKTAASWSLTSLREKSVKIGAKVTSRGRYITYLVAEIAVPRQISPISCRWAPGSGAPPALA
jgi:hypothetical protein